VIYPNKSIKHIILKVNRKVQKPTESYGNRRIKIGYFPLG
jgi:hypothetical protein